MIAPGRRFDDGRRVGMQHHQRPRMNSRPSQLIDPSTT